MKKFLSVMLLAATINYVYTSEENEQFFLKDGDQFLVCRLTDNGDEECCPLDIQELEKINKLIIENEKKAEELVKNIMSGQTRFTFVTLQTNPYLPNNNWRKRSQKSTDEERKKAEEIFPRPQGCLIPRALSNYKDNPMNRSMLPTEEQKMYDKIEEMVKTLNENENNNTQE